MTHGGIFGLSDDDERFTLDPEYIDKTILILDGVENREYFVYVLFYCYRELIEEFEKIPFCSAYINRPIYLKEHKNTIHIAYRKFKKETELIILSGLLIGSVIFHIGLLR
jgi:hypothetical protein